MLDIMKVLFAALLIALLTRESLAEWTAPLSGTSDTSPNRI
jgi:hypothetical protein